MTSSFVFSALKTIHKNGKAVTALAVRRTIFCMHPAILPENFLSI